MADEPPGGVPWQGRYVYDPLTIRPRGPRAGLTRGQRTSCDGVITEGAQFPGTGVRGWEPGDRGLEDSLGTSARGDLGPWRGDHLAWSDREMFVAAEVPLDVSFPAAAARFANLALGGLLTRASQGAYGDGLTGLVRVGPLGAVPGVSKLVKVHFLDVVTRGESAVLTLRWEATGPGGRLFPALDADIWLTPAGEHAARLSLAGVYRPPLAALGAGLERPRSPRWLWASLSRNARGV